MIFRVAESVELMGSTAMIYKLQQRESVRCYFSLSLTPNLSCSIGVLLGCPHKIFLASWDVSLVIRLLCKDFSILMGLSDLWNVLCFSAHSLEGRLQCF